MKYNQNLYYVTDGTGNTLLKVPTFKEALQFVRVHKSMIIKFWQFKEAK
jgi:hypothetical protein